MFYTLAIRLVVTFDIATKKETWLPLILRGFHKLKLTTVGIIVLLGGGGSQVMTLILFTSLFELFGSIVIFKASFICESEF